MEDHKASQPLLGNQATHGQKLEHDSSWKGIKHEGRRCNDLLFAVLFLLMFGAMIVIFGVGFKQGDPSRLIPSNEFSGKIENRAEYWFQDAVAYTKRDLPVLGGAFGFAIVLGLIWLQLLRMFTKIFIYLTLALGILLVLVGGLYCFSLGHRDNNGGLKIFSYCLFALTAFLIIGVIFLRNKINLTCALFEECCHGLQHNPAVFIVTGIVFALFAAFVVFWVAGFMYLYSVPHDQEVQVNSHLPPKFDQKVQNLLYYQVFAFFWVTAFISAVFQVSVAGAMASWYFSRDINGWQQNVGSPAIVSFVRAFTLSFGSLAFGSLILAVVQFINFMLKRAKQMNSKNRLAVCVISCVQCIFGCIQRLVQWIDRFAYIYIAMHGDSFCTSAKNVFDLVSRNMFTVVVVDFLGIFVLNVGKILGTAATTIFTLAITEHMHKEVSPLTIALIVIISFLVFHLFSKIISTGVDTIFVCYCEDLERNKEGQLYMTPTLHNMLKDNARKTNSTYSHNAN